MDDLECAAEPKINLETDRIGRMRQGQLGHVQAELIGLHIEVIQVIELRRRMVEIEAVITVHQTTEIDRPHRPGRRRRRCRGRLSWWRCRRRFLSNRSAGGGCLAWRRLRLSRSCSPLKVGQTLFQLFDSIEQDSFAQVIHSPYDLRAGRALLIGVCLLCESRHCHCREKQNKETMLRGNAHVVFSLGLLWIPRGPCCFGQMRKTTPTARFLGADCSGNSLGKPTENLY